MKRTLPNLFLTLIMFACSSERSAHLISDKEFRSAVHSRFLEQKTMAAGRDSVLFNVFDKSINTAETEALEFLYAFMPLSDLAMKDGKYNLSQVRTALEAREFFKWGETIPEEVFLHFVLPYRVNNEYTDTARQVFFRELKDRIKGMDMGQAALEVNHWCHEKVNYKSTDERTSGPLTAVRTAFGRCGEESTFTVAALRSVCIPARQVYTPRWAHTDDNHAWVEVWIDGKWHFMGACEPEPQLDMAWFAEPVKRAMMTHTFVYGQYKGNENVLERNDWFTRLNLLNNYTKTKTLPVKVLDAKGKPAANVKVEYQLYNYSEFYPIATQFTNLEGTCSAITGFGDLMIWASREGAFSFAIAPAALEDTLILKLQKSKGLFSDVELMLSPPVIQALPPTDTVDAAANSRRLLTEDSIRNAYIATFIDSAGSAKIAKERNLEADALWYSLSGSRGNYNEIISFINQLQDDELKSGMALLEQISEKDLHDVQAVTLLSHLSSAAKHPFINNQLDEAFYNKYILSPRIGREFLTPWRGYIQRRFSTEAVAFIAQPVTIAQWIAQNIKTDTISNYYGVPLSPEGMLELGIADKYSRDLLFVAICRSFGIPARLEPATRDPQYFDEVWKDVAFYEKASVSTVKGGIVLINGSADKDFIPQYSTHYTLGRLISGRFVTLDYEFDATLKSFPCRLKVDTGFYRIVTGNRQPDGSVLCKLGYFDVKPEENLEVYIDLVNSNPQEGILGIADMNAAFVDLKTKQEVKLHQFSGNRGMVIAVIDPGKEPTRHLMEDIKAVKINLDNWGGTVLFIVANDKLNPGFNPANYLKLPVNSLFGYDSRSEVVASITTVCKPGASTQWPVVALINKKGEITWHSEGYSIGLGDQLVKQIKWDK